MRKIDQTFYRRLIFLIVIPPDGLQTTLRVPDFPVRWFINDLNAIQTGAPSNVVISNFRRELQADAGTNDQELTLYWNQVILV